MQECAAQVQGSLVQGWSFHKLQAQPVGVFGHPQHQDMISCVQMFCRFFSTGQLSLSRLHTMKCPLDFSTKWRLFKFIQMPKKNLSFLSHHPRKPSRSSPTAWDCGITSRVCSRNSGSWYWECLCFPEAPFICQKFSCFAAHWFFPSSSEHVWTVPLKPLH